MEKPEDCHTYTDLLSNKYQYMCQSALRDAPQNGGRTLIRLLSRTKSDTNELNPAGARLMRNNLKLKGYKEEGLPPYLLCAELRDEDYPWDDSDRW